MLMHLLALNGGDVVPSCEVEEAVDYVEGDFAVVGVVMGGGLMMGGVETDEDFAVVKGDDIGGGGILEELAVDVGDAGVVDEADFDFFESS